MGFANVAPYADDIAVSGRSFKRSDSFYRVGLFSADGRRKTLAGAKDGDEQLCNVGPVAKGSRGMLVVDANCRALKGWSEAGAFQGTAPLEKLTGVSYPWVNSFAVREGVGYMVMGSDAKDSRRPGVERRVIGVVVRLTGL
jgi:hypothetical protein